MKTQCKFCGKVLQSQRGLGIHLLKCNNMDKHYPALNQNSVPESISVGKRKFNELQSSDDDNSSDSSLSIDFSAEDLCDTSRRMIAMTLQYTNCLKEMTIS